MCRTILHIDMDEFFAAVEKLDNPQLRGKPLLIGGDPKSRGVVSTASYEAREYGCHSAMPMSRAVRLCPHAIVLPVRGHRYYEVSKQIFDIFEQFTPLVEPLSVDEAFLDVTGCHRLLGSGLEIARRIKQRIRNEVGLTASVGVAPNMFLAKLGSEMEKPDGLTVISPDCVQEMLDPLKVEKLWGVGPAMAGALHRLNIYTVAQLRQTSPDLLTRRLGQAGDHLYRLARGLDDREVTPDHQAKSIGQEETFVKDIGDLEQLRGILLEQVEQVARRLRNSGLSARTVTLKLRYPDFTTLTRSTTLPEATDVTQMLWEAARALLDKWADQSLRPLRLLGATASQLSLAGAGQQSLFVDPREDKFRKVDDAMDQITRKYGNKAIRRGK